jgi:hypothetical protein
VSFVIQRAISKSKMHNFCILHTFKLPASRIKNQVEMHMAVNCSKISIKIYLLYMQVYPSTNLIISNVRRFIILVNLSCAVNTKSRCTPIYIPDRFSRQILSTNMWHLNPPNTVKDSNHTHFTQPYLSKFNSTALKPTTI